MQTGVGHLWISRNPWLCSPHSPIVLGLRLWLGTCPSSMFPWCPAIPRGYSWRHLKRTGWTYSIPELRSKRDLLKTEQVEKEMHALHIHTPPKPSETTGVAKKEDSDYPRPRPKGSREVPPTWGPLGTGASFSPQSTPRRTLVSKGQRVGGRAARRLPPTSAASAGASALELRLGFS